MVNNNQSNESSPYCGISLAKEIQLDLWWLHLSGSLKTHLLDVGEAIKENCKSGEFNPYFVAPDQTWQQLPLHIKESIYGFFKNTVPASSQTEQDYSAGIEILCDVADVILSSVSKESYEDMTICNEDGEYSYKENYQDLFNAIYDKLEDNFYSSLGKIPTLLYPIRTPANVVSSYFFYMWNSWSREECLKIFEFSANHIWSKWELQHSRGTFGAAERFYADLDDLNRNKLVSRAIEVYDGGAKANN